jgi:hypothetical protein
MISRIYAGLKQAGEEDLVEMKDKFHMEIKSIRFEKINFGHGQRLHADWPHSARLQILAC